MPERACNCQDGSRKEATKLLDRLQNEVEGENSSANGSRKRHRKAAYSDIDKALYRWFLIVYAKTLSPSMVHNIQPLHYITCMEI